MLIRRYTIVTILLCVLSCSALADPAADKKREEDIKTAKAAVDAKDWAKASSLIEAFAVAYPKDPAPPHFLRAEIYRGQGKAEQAADEIKAGLIAGKAQADTGWAARILSSIQSAAGTPSADLLERLGDGYRIARYMPEAAKCYETSLGKPDLGTDRGKRIRRWLITCHIRSKEWAKVEKEIDAVTAESPECIPWCYYSLGKNYERFRNYDAAIAAFTKAMPPGKTPPQSPSPKDIQTALAECYIGARQWDNATDLVKKLAAENPRDAAYWHECVGAIYQGQKKYAEGIAELKQAAAPKSAVTARKRLGECYRDGLPPSAAAPLIQELVDKYPDDGPYLPTVVGRMYQGMKEYDKAVADFRFVIARFPDARWQVWDACYYVGECRYAQGKGEEALTLIKDFYAKHPDRPMDYAIAYGKTLLYPAKDPTGASQVLAKALADHPNDKLIPEVRTMLITAYSDSGQIEKLADLLNSLAANAPASEKPGLLSNLADHYFAVQKFREAASMYQGVVSLGSAPKLMLSRAQYQLGLCYYNSGMIEEAKQAMQRVVEQHLSSAQANQARSMLELWANLEKAKR